MNEREHRMKLPCRFVRRLICSQVPDAEVVSASVPPQAAFEVRRDESLKLLLFDCLVFCT